MKTPIALGKRATKQFCRLIKGLEFSPGESKKIDNAAGLFMPCSIEVVGRGKDYTIISFSHYGEQNGDLMADPDMTFLVMQGVVTQYLIYPMTFRNDYLGIYQESITLDEDGRQLINPRLQRDHTDFANLWMNNIVKQQGI